MAVLLSEDSPLARDLYAAGLGLHEIAAIVDAEIRNGIMPLPTEAVALTIAVRRYELARRAFTGAR